MSKSTSRSSQHIQPGRPSSQHITTHEDVVETAEPSEAQAPGFTGKAFWVSILIWLTVFLGLSLTIWLDLVIGLFHK